MTKDMEKAKYSVSFSIWVFMGKTGLQKSQVPETSGKVRSKEDLPLVDKDQVREHSNKLDIYKLMRL